MVSKKIWLGMLVMMLVFGMTVVGNLEAQTDSRLNGTWVNNTDGMVTELKLQNGSFEQSVTGEETTFSKGTYTVRNEMITLTVTHVMLIGGEFSDELGLQEARWYTIVEYTNALKKTLRGYGMPDDSINEIISLIISPPPQSFSIVSSSLILSVTVNGETVTTVYTKK